MLNLYIEHTRDPPPPLGKLDRGDPNPATHKLGLQEVLLTFRKINKL